MHPPIPLMSTVLGLPNERDQQGAPPRPMDERLRLDQLKGGFDLYVRQDGTPSYYETTGTSSSAPMHRLGYYYTGSY